MERKSCFNEFMDIIFTGKVDWVNRGVVVVVIIW